MKMRYLKFRYWLACKIHGGGSSKSVIWLGAIASLGFKEGLKNMYKKLR